MRNRVSIIMLVVVLGLPLYAADPGFSVPRKAGMVAIDDTDEERQVNQLLSHFPAHYLPDDVDLRTSNAFLCGISAHVAAREKSDTRNIVMITQFCGSNVTREFFLSGRGEEVDDTDMYGWAIHDRHEKQLSRAELAELHQLLKDLPEQSVYPPLNRLILISIESGPNWIHRFYDLQNEPPGLKRIIQVFQDKSQ